MPTYLCHGFRWHRKNIRIFTVLHDIEDAAPEWVVGPATQRAMLATMRELYDFLPPPPPPAKTPASAAPAPETPAPARAASGRRRKGDGRLQQAHGSLALLEEYDPADLGTVSGAHAYVADHVVRVDLSAGVAGEMAAYEARMREGGSMSGGSSDETGRKKGAKGWFERLRGELEAGEDIRWYVVVCGDEERRVEGEGGGEDAEDGSDREDEAEESPLPPDKDDPGPPAQADEKRRGLRRFLSDLSLGGKAGAGK